MRNRNRKVWLIHRERKRSTETVSKEARLYLADGGFKSAISNRLKILRETASAGG